MAQKPKRTQGSKWITRQRRLAIYLRDGLACVYCGDSVENGAKLTLDHLKPYSKGGTNDSKNLVCACLKCNASRGNRTLPEFAKAAAGYLNHGLTDDVIIAHVKACVKRPLDIEAAKNLIGLRGSWSNVMESL